MLSNNISSLRVIPKNSLRFKNRYCLPYRPSINLSSSYSSASPKVIKTPSKFKSFTSSQIYDINLKNLSCVSTSSPVYSLLNPSSSTSTSTSTSTSSEKPFNILGIETSCDDTALSIINSNGEILSNIIFSQYDLYQKYGGFMPLKSSQLHQARINYTLKQALLASGLKSIEEIDAVGVTRGPGLETCLKVGYFKGLEIANNLGIPFVEVNHHEAHCLVGKLHEKDLQIKANKKNPGSKIPLDSSISYPFLSILVSGGHSSFYLCHGLGDFECLGTTLDDSLGESFDKVARELGLPLEKKYYDELFSEFQSEEEKKINRQNIKEETSSELIPPGYALELMAKYYELKYVKKNTSKNTSSMLLKAGFKVPMKHISDCNLSFSGVKNLFYNIIQGLREEEEKERLKYDESLDQNIEKIDENEEKDPKKLKKQKKLVKNASKSNNLVINKENLITLSLKNSAYLSYYYQELVFEHLLDRLSRLFYILEYKNINIENVFLVGGVGSNKKLQEKINHFLSVFNEKKENYIENLIRNDKGKKEITSTSTTSSTNKYSNGIEETLSLFNLNNNEEKENKSSNVTTALYNAIDKYNLTGELTPSIIEDINKSIDGEDQKINYEHFANYSNKKLFLNSSNNNKIVMNKNEYSLLKLLLNNHYINTYSNNNKGEEIKKVKFNYLPPLLCTDNGVMIAWAAFEKLKQGGSDPNYVGTFMLRNNNEENEDEEIDEENEEVLKDYQINFNSPAFQTNLKNFVKKYDEFIYNKNIEQPNEDIYGDPNDNFHDNNSFLLEYYNEKEGKLYLDINKKNINFKNKYYVKPRWNLVKNYSNNFMLSSKKYPF